MTGSPRPMKLNAPRRISLRLAPLALRGMLTVAWLFLSHVRVFAEDSSFDGALKPFLAEHCLRCHDGKKQKGDFRLDTLARDFASPLSAAHWGDVMGRISAGEMPPEDEKQPKAEDAARVAEWLLFISSRAKSMRIRSTICSG